MHAGGGGPSAAYEYRTQYLRLRIRRGRWSARSVLPPTSLDSITWCGMFSSEMHRCRGYSLPVGLLMAIMSSPPVALGGFSVTVTVQPKAEGAAVWSTIPLDCTGKDGPLNIQQATYGLPVGVLPGCTTTEVPIGNLNKAAGTECDGKEQCIVSSCPCATAMPGATCPPGVTCDPQWKDPAPRCPKGMTVIYRCGDSPWGWVFLALLTLGGGSYVVVGVAYAQRVQGRKATGGGSQALLRLHPHFAKWTEMLALVEDGVAYTSGRRGTRTPRPEQRGDKTEKTKQVHNEQKKERSSSSAEKKQKKERSKKSETAGTKQPLLEAPAPSTAGPASSNPTVGGPKATASAGGGRWVHVPT